MTGDLTEPRAAIVRCSLFVGMANGWAASSDRAEEVNYYRGWTGYCLAILLVNFGTGFSVGRSQRQPDVGNDDGGDERKWMGARPAWEGKGWFVRLRIITD